MKPPSPTPLGLRRSFGFGDRLGLATPGHLRACAGHAFAGIFAQQSIREMARTRRSPEAVMQAATRALADAGYALPWGADADHLKTPNDVACTAAAGFTFFTIDPSDHVCNAADRMSMPALETIVEKQDADELYGGISLFGRYLGKTWEAGGGTLAFSRETLLRAGVKYGRAVAHCETMALAIAAACAGRLYEIEVSVDETDTPTTPLEHLFFALELQRRGVVVVSLAPRFPGDFEKGVDYRGDLGAFEANLRAQHAIAAQFGPYKISIHSGSDKFSIYPVIGRVCGDLLHVKTAGTSYLEALRVVARTDPERFREIVAYAATRFADDRASYHISVREGDLPALLAAPANERERVFLDADGGRQVLHVTFGSVLTTGMAPDGRPFKDIIIEVLESQSDLHAELLERHFRKHLDLLAAG